MTRPNIISAYLKLPSVVLVEKVGTTEAMLKNCTLCPWECKVDRTAGKFGFSRTGDMPFVSSWGPHFDEERPLVGSHGSRTILFCNCNLGCIFCQNYTISHLGEGSEMTFERLAQVMLELQGIGCHNINLVTPTHQMPMILRAFSIAAHKDDAADGILNGLMGSTQITIGGGMMGGGMMGGGGTMMQTTAGTIGLATAVTTFMGSTANKSGLLATDMQTLINTLAASNGAIQ